MDPNVTLIEELEGNKLGLAYGLMIFEVHIHSSTISHQHESAELWIVLNGEGFANYNNVDIKLSKGSQLTVSPNSIHHIRNETAVPLQILSMWWRDAN